MRYHHANLNFVAFRADDLLAAANELDFPGFPWNDEWFLSMMAPRVWKKQFLIATRSLAAHYSHSPQRGGLQQTDVLERYRALANEMVCVEENKIPVT